MFTTGRSAQEVVDERGLAQISDEDQIATLIAQVLDDNPEQVRDYLQGKEQLRGWFVGQVMRSSRGKANPTLVNKLLTMQLSSLKKA